jgi:16S rRNA (cytidine1402-2'-O)-methyltransferase
MSGTLFLIPVTLGSDDPSMVIPQGVLEITLTLRYFIVEEIRSARRFLRSIDKAFPIDESVFYILNEHTNSSELKKMLEEVIEGKDCGLLSEAGLPGIADPGSDLISIAHASGVKVKPLSGPSSVILALISAGMNGQAFTFNGYLPIKPGERVAKIKEIEARSLNGITQIFMETPYRNMKLFNDLLTNCRGTTRLCIAAGITLPDEFIVTKSIAEWKTGIPDIDRIPSIFILQA